MKVKLIKGIIYNGIVYERGSIIDDTDNFCNSLISCYKAIKFEEEVSENKLEEKQILKSKKKVKVNL